MLSSTPPAAHESAMIRAHLSRWVRLIARGFTPRVFFNNPESFLF
jgi:hypothetical protein